MQERMRYKKMDNELFLLSGELRAVAHILRYQDYIHEATCDCDFPTALITVISDYLYYKAEHCLEASGLAPVE